MCWLSLWKRLLLLTKQSHTCLFSLYRYNYMRNKQIKACIVCVFFCKHLETMAGSFRTLKMLEIGHRIKYLDELMISNICTVFFFCLAQQCRSRHFVRYNDWANSETIQKMKWKKPKIIRNIFFLRLDFKKIYIHKCEVSFANIIIEFKSSDKTLAVYLIKKMFQLLSSTQISQSKCVFLFSVQYVFITTFGIIHQNRLNFKWKT